MKIFFTNFTNVLVINNNSNVDVTKRIKLFKSYLVYYVKFKKQKMALLQYLYFNLPYDILMSK